MCCDAIKAKCKTRRNEDESVTVPTICQLSSVNMATAHIFEKLYAAATHIREIDLLATHRRNAAFLDQTVLEGNWGPPGIKGGNIAKGMHF